jgi:hypothetical protein
MGLPGFKRLGFLVDVQLLSSTVTTRNKTDNLLTSFSFNASSYTLKTEMKIFSE